MGVFDKSFKMFEVQTKLVFADRAATENETGHDVLLNRLKDWDKVECIIGGLHSLKGQDISRKDGKTPEDPHLHWYVKMKGNKPTKLSTILSKLNGVSVNDSNYIAPNLEDPDSLVIGCAQIENIHGSFKDCFDYITHSDPKSLANPLKHHYTEEEACVFYWNVSKEQVEQMTDKNEKTTYIPKEEQFWSSYGELIENGQLTRSRLIKDPELVSDVDFLKYKTLFDRAFDRHEKIKLAQINKEGIQMDVIYCYGASACGKTVFAKEYCKQRHYDFFISGSSNDPFDGYLGEEAIILDDLRGECFAFADLLKILDNNTRSQVKSRFYNKVVTCKVIIITSVLSIDALYAMFMDDENCVEPLEQLKRRCQQYLIFGEKEITVNAWNADTKEYDFVMRVPNIYKDMYKPKTLSPVQKVDMVKDLFKGFGQAFEQMSSYIDAHQDTLVKTADKEAEEPSDPSDPILTRTPDEKPLTRFGDCPMSSDYKRQHPACKGCPYLDSLSRCQNVEHPYNIRKSCLNSR